MASSLIASILLMCLREPTSDHQRPRDPTILASNVAEEQQLWGRTKIEGDRPFAVQQTGESGGFHLHKSIERNRCIRSDQDFGRWLP